MTEINDVVKIEYKKTTIASLKAGQTAILPCKDKTMNANLVVTVPTDMNVPGEIVEEYDGTVVIE
jgi:hypothetical protein